MALLPYDVDTLNPDFTPTATLYQAYLDHVHQYQHHATDPEILNAAKFGIAFRRIFDIEDWQRRRCRGEWGYVGVRGPGSRLIGRRGNPNFHKAAPAPAEVQKRDETDPDEDV